MTGRFVEWLDAIRLSDIARVGGKTASLGQLAGELASSGVRVPEGFAITAEACRAVLDRDDLRGRLAAILSGITGADVLGLATAGAELRRLVELAPWPPGLEAEIVGAYRSLAPEPGLDLPGVAVRSSATAEDLPDASFAGQHESFLGVRGEAALLAACRRCLASIFTDRAIVYRIEHAFEHLSVSLSIAVQRRVASDRASSGVVFTLDPDTGFSGVVLVNAAFGLGEAIVQGQLDPDEFLIFKPTLRSGHDALLRKRIAAKTWKLGVGPDGRPERAALSPNQQDVASLSEGEALDLARTALRIEMVPFCRTPAEGQRVLDLLAGNGLKQGVNGLEVLVMAEIPANAILVDTFAALFDGFSIGSNDLTQLVLGVDRDSELVAPVFDERDAAVLSAIAAIIEGARRAGRPVGICGQAPSDYPEIVRFLVGKGIGNISLNPDAFVPGREAIAAAETAAAGSREGPAAC